MVRCFDLQRQRCRCGRHFDCNADHLFTSPHLSGNGRTLTHSEVVNWTAALNRAAQLPTTVEPRGTFIALDEINHPDGHVTMERRFLDLYSGDGHLSVDGRSTLCDITGVHGMTSAVYVGVAIPTVEGLMNQRHRRKIAKYQRAVSNLGYNFIPLVFESYSGLLHQDFLDFVTVRSRLIADRLGLRFAAVRRHWLMRLSCILRRQFAFTITNRIERF